MDLCMQVDKEQVGLESVELLFKDQYLGRCDMWRLRNSLLHSVVFINKKVSFCKVPVLSGEAFIS